jgi:hypothetical protein
LSRRDLWEPEGESPSGYLTTAEWLLLGSAVLLAA